MNRSTARRYIASCVPLVLGPSPVWFITGASSGIGYALANAVLRAGDRVVLTARQTLALESLGERHSDRALVAALDVNRPDQVLAVTQKAEAHFGSIDVLVNSAGVGYISAVEEGSNDDIRWQFETNFFGPAALIRAVLPGMRARKRGHIVNISSVAGFVSRAGLGYYSASKFALEGLTEALWQEVEPLGIKVLLVEPGGFRTGMVHRTRTSQAMTDYAQTAGIIRNYVQTVPDEAIPGDPVRAAEVIIGTVRAEQKPHRAVFGEDAYTAVVAKLTALQSEYGAGEKIAASTSFPIVVPKN